MTIVVNTPDGGQAHFPDGTTPDVMQNALRQKFGGPQQPSPQDAAFAAGRQAGNDGGALSAGIDQAAQQGTFGLSNYVNAGVRSLSQGKGFNMTDPENLAFSRGRSEGEAEGHPIASTVGGAAGALALGAPLAKAAKLIPGAGAMSRFIAPQAGKAVGNVAKAAAVSAAAGGGQALAQGQDLPQAEETAGLSAGAGVVGGKVMSFALNKLQPAARKAMMTLADTLDETPATLQAAYDSFMKLTGRPPNMAEVTNLKSQGALRKLAAANSTVGDSAAKAAQLGNAPLHEQLAAAQNSTFPQTQSGILELRDAETDAAMNTPHPQTGVKLKDEPVSDPQGLLLDPHVDYALRPNTTVNARLNQTSQPFYSAKTNTATIGDIDTIRKALRDQQNSFMRPAPGSANSRDPMLAKEFGDLANKVESLGAKQVPDYGAVLDNYRQHSRYSEGFQHGLKGNAVDDVPEGDTMLGAALKTPSGIAGYEHGNALHNAQQALNIIAPGSVRPQEAPVNAGHVAQGAMAASSGGISAIYHAMRAIPGMHLPDNVQQIIAKQLFDPRTAQQGINNLRRAGIDADNLRQIAGLSGLSAGAHTGEYLSNNGR